jgi:glutathione S-transferase
LGEKRFFYGDNLTAIDLVVAYTMCTVHEKVDWLKEFPNLLSYYERLKEVSPAYVYATTGEGLENLKFKNLHISNE